MGSFGVFGACIGMMTSWLQRGGGLSIPTPWGYRESQQLSLVSKPMLLNVTGDINQPTCENQWPKTATVCHPRPIKHSDKTHWAFRANSNKNMLLKTCPIIYDKEWFMMHFMEDSHLACSNIGQSYLISSANFAKIPELFVTKTCHLCNGTFVRWGDRYGCMQPTQILSLHQKCVQSTIFLIEHLHTGQK